MRPRLAVILAAGRGVRLGHRGLEIPKGFITIAGRPIVERSIDALKGAGIERIRIVTGHLAPQYDALAGRGDVIETVFNPEYADTGSLVSLLCAGPIDEPYLLVESDLLYDVRAPRLLVESSFPDVLLASGPTSSGDEVYVAAADGRLTDLNKSADALRGPRVGELVGITRVSQALHARILQEAKTLLAATRRVEYEHALVAAARHQAIHVLVAPDLVWTEIDDESHLARARGLIAPRLGLPHT
jgi:choline kinase